MYSVANRSIRAQLMRLEEDVDKHHTRNVYVNFLFFNRCFSASDHETEKKTKKAYHGTLHTRKIATNIEETKLQQTFCMLLLCQSWLGNVLIFFFRSKKY